MEVSVDTNTLMEVGIDTNTPMEVSIDTEVDFDTNTLMEVDIERYHISFNSSPPFIIIYFLILWVLKKFLHYCLFQNSVL